MINILGGASPESHLPLVKKAKSMFAPKIGVYPHLYGKQSKPGRKIGHITLTGLEGSIKDLEEFAQPLVQLAADMRQERIEAKSKAMRPEQAVTKAAKDPLVLVTMGSDSDLPVLKAGLDILTQFGVPWEVDITSAHRTPVKMGDVATAAADRGIKVIIAAAGGAAHLPGMISAYTPLPVIGVPVKATHLDGMDSLLSIVQMPVSFITFPFNQHKLTRTSEASPLRPWASTTPPTQPFLPSASWVLSSPIISRR
jgi:phosphoribosylaminoimidazole carboxylase